MKPEFISYDGAYPNLCRGKLRFKLGDNQYVWYDALTSGGSVSFNEDWSEEVTEAPWSVDFPDDFPMSIRPAVVAMVNEKVPHGCCGGCV